MSSTEHHPAFDSLTPSAKLALLHAQTAAPQDASVEETMVPSANDPVVTTDFSEPLIAGDYPTPISKPAVIKKEKKKDDKLDLASESAFPSLSSGSSRAPITSGWSAAAVSRVKTQPVTRSMGRAPASNAAKKSTVPHITDVLELPANQQTANQPVKPLGFKSNSDVIQQVINKTGTTIIASTNRSGTTTFLIQGTPADTEKAKRELIAGLVVKRTAEVAVPSSTRRFIIGAKGKTLQMIEAKSGTRINIPPRKEEDELNEENDEEMVNVTIVGDAAGIKIAQAEIEAIVGDKTAKQTIKLENFHYKYHLLLAGPQNGALKSIEETLGVKVQTPPIVTGYDVLVEGKVRDNAFVLSGDKEKVQQAKQILEDRYNSLEKDTKTVNLSVSKRQHKYLIGKNGSTLREIFDKSGCSVELPASTDASEEVTIRGHNDCIINGLTAVLEKSNAVHVAVLDIPSIFTSVPNPQQHSKNVLKYIVKSGHLKKIEQDHDVEISVPRADALGKSVPLEFVSKVEKNGVSAYQDGFIIFQNLVPALFSTVKVEPHLYHYISVRHGKQLQRIKARYSVAILVPDNENEEILIVYEGKEGDDQETKLSEAKEALDAVTAEIKKIASDSSDYISNSITIPAKFHRAILGPKGTTLNAILGEDSTVVVRFGGANEDEVIIRGTSSEVKRTIEELNKVHNEAKYDDFSNSYTAEFEIPVAFSPHVIGKSGSNINKLKDDLGVRIDISDPNKSENGETIVKSKKKNDQKVKIIINGIKTNVEAAKERISAMVSNLADQVTLSLSVPKEFHRFLIGPSGRFVKKLEDKYNVYIKFPKSFSTETEDPDVITIRGRKKEASAAKDELFELYEYEKDEQIKRKERDARFAEERKKREADAAARAEAAAAKAEAAAAKTAAAEVEAEKST
ncbi:hypothetical protein F4703DRAFT_1763827 [Phycomyces blakesleeanus]